MAEYQGPWGLVDNAVANYDATIAPRFIEKRGLMTELELRQLSQYGKWVVAGAYLKDDKYTGEPPYERKTTKILEL